MSFSILIVDDEPDIADLFRQRFRQEVRQGQYVLHFAGSGEEALGRFSEIHPELIVILSDINMPGMDGLERRADELGAAAFLAKPVDFDQLKQHLLRLMPGDPAK
jgi:CheY-like chemotaxis protein